jgi:phage shock protein C
MVKNDKKLYRSANDKFIGGVCGGVAEYLNVDSSIIRILWLTLIFFGGTGILLYIVSLIIIPLNPEVQVDQDGKVIRNNRINFGLIFGSAIIIIGLLILLHNLDFIPYRFWRIKWDIVFGVMLIICGVYLFIRNPENAKSGYDGDTESTDNTGERNNKYHYSLFRSVTDKKIFGVCGGIAEYFQFDSSIVRIAFVFFVFFTGGLALLLYFIMGLVLPEKRFAKS